MAILGDAPYVEMHEHAAKSFGQGPTFMEKFGMDQFAEHRKINMYYPFVSRQDWEVGSWLLRSGLSMAGIDSFLSLELVRASFYVLSTYQLDTDWDKGTTYAAIIQNRKTAMGSSRNAPGRSSMDMQALENNSPNQKTGEAILP